MSWHRLTSPAPLARALAVAGFALALFATPARAEFGLLPGAAGFDVTATEADGSRARTAGSHPDAVTATVGFAQTGSDGDVRDLSIEWPPGLTEDSRVVEACTQAQFNTPRISPFQQSLSGESCPDKSQIGLMTVSSGFGGGTTRTFGLFNLVAPPGMPSLIGASPFGSPIVFSSAIRSAAGGFGMSLSARDVSQRLDITGLRLTLWGNPWLVGHDQQRGNCLNETDPAAGFGTTATIEREPQTVPPSPPFYEPGTCSIGNPKIFPPLAYLTLPNSCAGPMRSVLTATAWGGQGQLARESVGHDDGGNPLALSGCEPHVLDTVPNSLPTTDRAASASGLDFTLDLGQDSLTKNVTPVGRVIPGIRTPSQAKKAVVRLPEGMTINPSLAAGLGVCRPDQFEAETALSPPGAGCPNDSKIGVLTVVSPLFEKPLEGGVFLAEPYDNPFGSLVALYLVAKSPERGVIVKLPGEIAPDPATGRLVTTFDQLPQLPYSHLDVHFRDGQRSPLATPAACGEYATQMELSPWLDPSVSFSQSTRFGLSKGLGGGPCPSARAPFDPQGNGGLLNRNAGSYSTFQLLLSRADTDQEIVSYAAKLPPGLLGKIAGIPFCPESAIEAAKRNSGVAETEHPSCPAASRIGRTLAGYGIGSVLAYAPGGLYQAGPFHGAPLSIVAVDAATVGPFDLGTVVVRSGLEIEPRTAQVSISSGGSDPIPHILKGIPIHLHDLRIYTDRPNFTVNPTSCERFSLSSTLGGAGAAFSDPSDDTSATVSNPFQVSFCSSLGFEPKMELRFRGGTKRGRYPSLTATVSPRPGDANIGTAQVTLPPSIFLAQNHIQTICTRAQSAAGKCPSASIYGHARAVTPLMDEPLEGPVYLRASDNRLPDLVAQLSGRGVRIDVVGRIDSKDGGMRATYEVLPDAPVTKFSLTLNGGKRGLLVNSDDVCTAEPATVRMSGQNNKGVILRPPLLNSKCKKHGKGRKHRAKKHHRGASAKATKGARR